MQRREQICLELSKEWGVSWRSVDKMIQKAANIIKDRAVRRMKRQDTREQVVVGIIAGLILLGAILLGGEFIAAIHVN